MLLVYVLTVSSETGKAVGGSGYVRSIGYQGFLIGENFMKTDDPFESAYNFIKEVENEI